jgi:transposase
MGASIGSGPEIGPPMGAQLVAGATSPARASQVIAVDHRRPFEAHLGNTVRARVERTLAWFARFRRLTTRYERRADIFEAFHHLAARLICLRFVERWSC